MPVSIFTVQFQFDDRFVSVDSYDDDREKQIVASLFLFSKCFRSFAKCSPVQKVSSLYFIRTALLCTIWDLDDDEERMMMISITII